MIAPPPQQGNTPRPYPEMLAARGVALRLLDMVLTRRTPLDQAQAESMEFSALPARDRAFARMVIATTLRRLGQIDALILRASDNKPAPQPPVLHHLLRMGVAQILFMAVPDHAAVNTAVQLAEQLGLARQKGFVNAVLRRIAREGAALVAAQDESRLNIPGWLLADWATNYGPVTADSIAQALLAEAPLDITVKDPAKREYWADVLHATILPGGSLRLLDAGNIPDLPGFHDGMWWVQDAAAALPARLFGAVRDISVIDLCAAPGGKTAQLAAMGAHVTALDRSGQRLRRLNENLRRLRLERFVQAEVADASVWRPAQPAHAILLDAPCSATGTIRRHPDVLRLKTPDDVVRLAELQARLLDNAAQMLAPGGTLVYCTCSLQPAEGENQIDALLARNATLARQPVTAAETGNMPDVLTMQGDVRILPFALAPHGGMDGFFAARLRKGQ